MRLSRYSVWMGIGCGIAGLAISAFAKADAAVGRIKLEGSLPADQIAMLKYDREVFATFQVPETDTTLKSLLGTNSTSTDALNAWLEARVHVVVGEGFDAAKNTVDLAPNYSYANPGIYPSIEVSKIVAAPGVLIMANAGVSLYYGGKARSTLVGLKVDGVGTIPMTSPRSGVIQIGPGLFHPPYPVDAKDPHAAANSILRLGTFFHESHHSDGNGASMGFYHAICPLGHVLQGWNACDRNTNGPYAIGGQMMKAMTESCKQCTRGQIEALRLQYTDSFGRALPTQLDGVTPVTHWNEAPEGVL